MVEKIPFCLNNKSQTMVRLLNYRLLEFQNLRFHQLELRLCRKWYPQSQNGAYEGLEGIFSLTKMYSPKTILSQSFYIQSVQKYDNEDFSQKHFQKFYDHWSVRFFDFLLLFISLLFLILTILSQFNLYAIKVTDWWIINLVFIKIN